MGILDKLKANIIEPRKRPRSKSTKDLTAERRKKFVAYLTEQKNIITGQAPNKKRGSKRNSSMYFFDEEINSHVLPLRYGSVAVAIFENRSVLSAKSKDELVKLIDAMIEATNNGELDNALENAAKKPPRMKTQTTASKSSG